MVRQGNRPESRILLTSPGVSTPDIHRFYNSPSTTLEERMEKGSSFFKKDQGSTRTDSLHHHLRSTKESKKDTGRTQRHKYLKTMRKLYETTRGNKNSFSSTYKQQNRLKSLPLVRDPERLVGRTTVVLTYCP